MRLFLLVCLFQTLPLWALTLEIFKSTEGPIYQGVPFKGMLKISSYQEDEDTLKNYFSDIKSGKFLYIVQSLGTKKTIDSLELSGIFSLLFLPEDVQIGTETYQFQNPKNKFIPLTTGQSVISLDHKKKNRPWYLSWKWITLLSALTLFLFYFIRKIFLNRKHKKYQVEQADQIISNLKKSQSRKEFEDIYLQKDKVYNAFYLKINKNPLDETPMKLKKFFEKIQKNLYIKHWNNTFLQELTLMRDKI